MVQLRSKILEENIKFAALLKKFTFIFLTWTCLAYNDVGIFTKSLEHKYEHDKIMNINFNRLLARHVQQRELGYSNLREKLSDLSVVEKKKKIADQLSTNSQLRGKKLNYIDAYMKDYEKRYKKKKGISKLDCYFEKSVFDKIHNLCEFDEKMQNKKRFKKYVIVLILIALIPALGFIFPILFNGTKDSPGILNWCKGNNCGANDACKKNVTFHGTEDAFRAIEGLNFIFICVSIIAVLLNIIYTFIKIIKYVGLKNGKESMRAKEYLHICKDLFSNK